MLGALVVAGSVPGGVVAFQFAMNFFNLPVALAAKPVGVAMLPRLSRLHARGEFRRFHDQWVQGWALALFAAVPASLAYVVLAGPLARAVAFGAMASHRGIELLSFSLGAIGLGVIGESSFVLATQAWYARREPGRVVQAMVLRAALTAVGMALAVWLAHDAWVVLVLGVGMTFADLTASGYLVARLMAALPPRSVRLRPTIVRTVIASVAMAIPALVVATTLDDVLPSRLGSVGALVAAMTVGFVFFVVIQRAGRSDELAAVGAAVHRWRTGKRP